MPAWLLFTLFALAFAGSATWVSRRLLDPQIGWFRASITALVVFVLCTPIALWVLDEADVLRDGEIFVDTPIALAFILLTLAWAFAAVVIAIMIVEFLWPTHGFVNPITAVRDALRRRDRARRYAQILAIASRHGLGAYRNRRGGEGEVPAAALVAAMNDAGVTFVKLGQVLSSREDVLPRNVIDALSTLQMDSTPIPWPAARAAIEAELKRPLDEVFATIDETPLAAASVAQVHAATLVSGEDVVVKVQRPSAREQVTVDVDILGRLAAEAERRTGWARDYGLESLVKEFARGLHEELDYRIEAANTEMLRGATEKSETRRLKVPQVFAQYSTERMLVQERATGTPFSRLEPGSLPPDEARAICDDVTDAIVEQIAVRGVFHADLHPGNLLLDDDGTVTLIDFGSVGIVRKSMRRLLLPLLISIANEDDGAATDAVLMLCIPAVDDSREDAALEADIGLIITRLHNSPGENVFSALVGALRAHRLALPPALLLVLRTLASLEGTLRRLVPDYDMTGRGIGRSAHFARAAISPEDLLLSAQSRLALTMEQVRGVPRRLESISRALQDGTFAVRIHSFGDPGERRWVDAIVGRLTTTLVGIALVLTGIQLTVSSDGPMLTSNVPAYSFLGSIVGLGGLLLLLRVLREALRRRDE